jgi:hypothetical protein
MTGTPGRLTRLEGTDAPQGLQASAYTASDGAFANSALITVEAHNIRLAFHEDDLDATHGAMLYVGDVLDLRSIAQIERFRFIDAVSGEHGAIQFIPYF